VSRKIRILGPVPPPHGGVSVYIDGLRRLLKGSGVRFWSYPYKDRRHADTQFFRHRRLGILPLLVRDGYRACVLDASHFHLEYPNPILLPIWLALKSILVVQWIKIIHDGSLPARAAKFGWLQKTFFKIAVRSATEFVVVHDDLRTWLQDEIGVSQSISIVPALLPQAAEAETGSLSSKTEAALRPYFEKPLCICSIGVFISEYGFAHVAEAIDRLRAETGEDIGLVLLDGTFKRDENYRNAVMRGRTWITALENVPNSEVFSILKRSNAFVRGFGHESYGISRVEAIWAGVPVVATNVGETRGMLTYDFGDVDGLKRQLTRALFEPQARDLKGFAAMFRREAEENLSAIKRVLGIA
jgi:glycosyltransferase involved in cell wall biosynthesis